MAEDQLLAYLRGQLTSAEHAKVEHWLVSNTEHQQVLNELAAIWQLADIASPKPEVDKAWQKLNHQLPTGSRILRLGRWVAVAASFLLLLSIGWWLWPNPITELYTNTYQLHHRLPDSTQVHLNRHSQLSYSDFDGKERHVTLEGEAFFAVSKDPTRPFIISVDKAKVKVLGTAFQVQAYPGEELLVQVKEGTVAVSVDGQDIVLQAGEAAAYVTNSGLRRLPNLQEELLAWHTHRFTFDDQPLAEVVQMLAEAYQQTIRLENTALQHCPLKATFDGQTLPEVLELLTFIYNMEYTFENGVHRLAGGSCSEE